MGSHLLDGIERQRPLVAGIGLDDVGSHPSTVAMLPLVTPNVIKIDGRVTRAAPDEEVARLLNALNGEAARTGAVILAEGVGDRRTSASRDGPRRADRSGPPLR